MREANQAASLQPTVLVSYRADLGPVFDSRNSSQIEGRGMSECALADPGWRTKMIEGKAVQTQGFAHELVTAGFAGLLIQSCAKGASGADLNIVLWRWSGADCELEVVDDEGRLARM